MTKNATAPKNETSPKAFLMERVMSDLPPADEAQHYDDHDEQHRQHEQRNGGAVRYIAGEDADLEALEAEHRGCIDWTAVRQKEDDRQVGERENDPENQPDGHDRQDHRQDDLVVAAPETRTVNGSGVNHILRNGCD